MLTNLAVSAQDATFGAAGGVGTFASITHSVDSVVNVSQPWVHATLVTDGVQNGIVNYSVDPNPYPYSTRYAQISTSDPNCSACGTEITIRSDDSGGLPFAIGDYWSDLGRPIVPWFTFYMLIGGSLDGANACYVKVQPEDNAIYLMNDAGTDWQGPITPGEGWPNWDPTLSNSWCGLDAWYSSLGNGYIRDYSHPWPAYFVFSPRLTLNSGLAGQSLWIGADYGDGTVWQQIETGGGGGGTPVVTLDPPSAFASSASGAGSFAVSVTPSGPWTATTNDSWITLTPPTSGTGQGAVSYTLASNMGPQRIGSVQENGAAFQVTQLGGGQPNTNTLSLLRFSPTTERTPRTTTVEVSFVQH